MRNLKLLVSVALLWLIVMAAHACSSDGCDKTRQRSYVPAAPDYEKAEMWYERHNDKQGNGADVFYVVSTWEKDWTAADGKTCHYADVWNETHRNRMKIEISKVADYMADGNDFYAPYYRHTTIEAWTTLNEDTIRSRTRLAMDDVKAAFDHFLARRDSSRPFIIAGFSQAGWP